jgi:spore cortex biosynthesis protein YabQ
LGIYLAQQTIFFLQAALLGAALGFFYDAFRITRMAIPTSSLVVFIEDVLFFICAAVCTFFFLMQTIHGQVRFFIFIGEAIGALLYFMAISPTIMKISHTIIKVFKSIVRLIIRWIFLPVLKLIRAVILIILKPVFFIAKFIKKTAQKCNYRLKVRSKVLYNQVLGIFISKKRKAKRRTRRKTKRKSRRHDPQKAKKARKAKTSKKSNA